MKVSQCIVESLDETLGKDDYTAIKFIEEENEKKKKLDKLTQIKFTSFGQLKKVA